LVRTGAEFLAASWMTAAAGGQAPIDLGESAYRDLADTLDAIADRGLPLWRISPFTDVAGEPGDAVTAAASYRGDLDRAIADMRATLAAGGTAVLVVVTAGTAARAATLVGEADLPVVVV